MNAQICERTNILNFLFAIIHEEGFEQNKLYASEILSILVQTSSKNQILVGKLSVYIDGDGDKKQRLNGVDALLVALSKYRKGDGRLTFH